MSIDEIRARTSATITEIVSNPREYYRAQQILRDRSDLLVAYDALAAELRLAGSARDYANDMLDRERARIAALEAALREIAKFRGTGGDGNACARIAAKALGSEQETEGKRGS